MAILTQLAQLNCECDYTAKKHYLNHLCNQQTDCCCRRKLLSWLRASRWKMTTDASVTVQFHIGSQLERQAFLGKGILTQEQFNMVDWKHVSLTLSSIPKLIQMWAAKKTHQIAGTMTYLHYQMGCLTICSSTWVNGRLCNTSHTAARLASRERSTDPSHCSAVACQNHI